MFAYRRVLWHSSTLVSVRALGWPDGSGSPRCATEVGLNLRRRFSALSCTVVDNSVDAGRYPVPRVSTREARHGATRHGGESWGMCSCARRRGEGSRQVSDHQLNLGVVWEQVVRQLSAGTLSPQLRA